MAEGDVLSEADFRFQEFILRLSLRDLMARDDMLLLLKDNLAALNMSRCDCEVVVFIDLEGNIKLLRPCWALRDVCNFVQSKRVAFACNLRLTEQHLKLHHWLIVL